jgi:hypothetical protein
MTVSDCVRQGDDPDCLCLTAPSQQEARGKIIYKENAVLGRFFIYFKN